MSLFHCVLKRETSAHAVLARLTYPTQQRSDAGEGSPLIHTPEVSHSHSSSQLEQLHKTTAEFCGMGGGQASPAPHCCGAPAPLQLFSTACFHVQSVFSPGTGPGRSMFVALLQLCDSQHARGGSGHNPAPSLSLVVSQYRAPFLLPVCKLKV